MAEEPGGGDDSGNVIDLLKERLKGRDGDERSSPLPWLRRPGNGADWNALAELVRAAAEDPSMPFRLEWVERLAALQRQDRAAFERVRAELRAAKVRVSVLDRTIAGLQKSREPAAAQSEPGAPKAPYEVDPDPWPEAVDGAVLLDTIRDVLAAHLVLPPGGAEAAALWILHAHAHDAAMDSPILTLSSPLPECGKTRLLGLVGALVPRPLSSSNLTSAALFRSVELWHPTLLIDEVDSFLKDSEELRGVLNSGHGRATAFVLRTVGDDHTPKQFRTWSPKALALIGVPPATILSRSIVVSLRRMMPGENAAPLPRDYEAQLDPLRRQAWRWAQDHMDALSEADPALPAGLQNRAGDNWRPLFAIGDLAGGRWPDTARRIATTIFQRSDESALVLLLADLRDLFAQRGEQLTSAEIVSSLTGMEERPWAEWRQGKPLSPSQLARLLGPLGIGPSNIRTGPASTPKGYKLSAFLDAFARYLDPALS